MKKLALLLALLCSPALAQNPGVTTQGAVTNGHCVKFVNRNLIADNGAACAGATSFAAPTVAVDLTPTAGVLTTALRSDAGLTLNQAAAWQFTQLAATTIKLNSTTALSAQKADATVVFQVDTTNKRVGIGVAPTSTFQITDGAYTFKLGFATGFINYGTGDRGWTNFGTDGVSDIMSFFNSANTIKLTIDKDSRFIFDNLGVLAWATNSGMVPDLFLTRRGAANLALGSIELDTTGVSQTLSVQGVLTGGTNNQAGGSLTVQPGQGKGNVGGSLIFKAPTLGGSGNTLQTMTEVVRLLASTTPAWQWSANNSTGAGAALLGANSPASTLTAPYTWVQVVTSDGSTGYMPVWK